jgi:predicted transcriptional regulator YdeE
MKKAQIHLPEIRLVGITARTNNQDELNGAGKIGPCVQQYFQQQLFAKIPHRKNPGKTFCAYTDYESDHRGAYTFFIGEEAEADCPTPEGGFKKLTIPSQAYARFTTEQGPMPAVVINAWQKIWSMTVQDFGRARRYHTDFELYDERASDPQNAMADIYIGIQA